MSPIVNKTVDRLKVQVYADRAAMGAAAGHAIAARMRQMLAGGRFIRMIFAAAPSQNETLQTLVKEPGLDWSRVTAFHMDEYVGLSKDAPQSFARFVQTRIFDVVKPGEIHLINGAAAPEAECERYGALLKQAPIDIVCMGIGENGHIAFNDPPVADFHDPKPIKVVELDNACRQQQVNDGCFPTFDAVPTHALTLTIPTLTSGRHLFCMVPGPTKKAAIHRTLHGIIATECPSTILRHHADCTLYVDKASYGLV